MKCQECHCVSDVNGEYFTDCELYGQCYLGDKVCDCPEEQLDIFKEETYDVWCLYTQD